MKIQLLLLVFLPSIFWLQAQSPQRERIRLNPTHFSKNHLPDYNKNKPRYICMDFLLGEFSDWVNIPIEADPFIAFSMAWKQDTLMPAVDITYRFDEDENWWQQVKPDEHYHSEEGRKVSQLIFKDNSHRRVKLRIGGSPDQIASLEYIDLHFFTPGNSEPQKADQVAMNRDDACPCSQPSYLNRQGWCPTNDCAEHPNPQQTAVTHLVVHHSAGTNVSSNWSGVVRSIWDFHVNVNGWDDIGYNWLIDPNGVVYEGRGDNIQGAHFCGKNGGTAGICMLGDYTNITPSDVAYDQLVQFLSWKSCDVGIDPVGQAFHASSSLTLPNIAGHREGCSTACPGDSFYPLFVDLRTEVKNYQEGECSEFLAPTDLIGWAINDTKIQLQWKDNSGSETAFLLERSKNNNSNYSEIAQLAANFDYYTDEDVNPGTAYFYRVRASNNFETTDYSNEYGVTTILTSTENTNIGTTEISVHPNPSNGPIQLMTKGNYYGAIEVQLVDLEGQILRNWQFEKNDPEHLQVLDFEKEDRGIFVLEVKMGRERVKLKVLRMH